MKQVLAILRDSYHEAIARRSLVVMIVLSTLPIIFFASLRFEEASVEEAVQVQANTLAEDLRARSAWRSDSDDEAQPLIVSEVTAAKDNPGPNGPWGAAVQDGWTLTLSGDLGTATERRNRWFRGWKFRNNQPVPEDAGWRFFAEEYFKSKGFATVEVQESNTSVAVAVIAEDSRSVAGGHRLRMLWGAINLPLKNSSAGMVLVAMQSAMAVGLVGFVGILLAVILTAALIPNMLEKGTLDLVLARPIGRTKLLITKYVGGCWFVAILGTYAIAGSWLALRVATGHGSAWVMIAIPAMIGAFATLYSVSALIGVLTRSTLNSILAACGVWFVSSMIEAGRKFVAAFGNELAPWISQAMDTAYWVFPKLGAFDTLVVSKLAETELPTGIGAMAAAQVGLVDDLEWALASNFIFAAIMLTLAVWLFRKRDY